MDGVRAGGEEGLIMAYMERAVTGMGGSPAAVAVIPAAMARTPVAETWSDIVASPRTRPMRLAEHEILFHEGDPADRLYLVVDGAVMLYKLLPDGRRQVVEIHGPGDLVGLAAGDEHDCVAETLVSSGFKVIDRRDAETSVAGQRHIARCLRDQVAVLHDHAVLLGRKSAFERVASFLVRMVPGRGRPGCVGRQGEDNGATVRLAMTRQEIADYLGLTIETVSRVISEMRRRGMVVAERQDKLRIPDVCAMCRLSGMH
jgi:CRP/FNR family nitrogen fixation transcriptional regulator